MCLFNSKARKAKKAKLELIDRMSDMKKGLESNSLYRASDEMRKVIGYAGRKEASFTEEQISSASKILESMKPYSSTKRCDEILKKKCETIDKILKTGPLTKEEEASEWNDTKMLASMAEQEILTKQIANLDSQMKANLKNKSQWQFLYMQQRKASNRLAMLEKNFQSILQAESNLSLANEAKEASKDASVILDQSNLTDVSEFEDNVGDITQAADSVVETGNELNDIFAKNFDSSSIDGAYEKALEEAKLEEATSSQGAGALQSEKEPK